ncbi:uncharacterized protein LOC143555399 [Bidens hawaiensis]|uniref:uncharacterized protein LOC143555399 n=1 Tax=Bidens hawaiensis TaxID=980011 RepID=UPI004049ECA9
MKLAADKHRRDVQFMVNDWVFVKLQPYRQGSVRLQRHHKLGHRYFYPYRVVTKIGAVAYKLDLPANAKIHPVFHVSLLRKCIGKPVQQITPLHLVDSTSTLLFQPHKVLQTRTISKGSQLVSQSVIHWDNLTEAEATWKDNAQLQVQFPNFPLEDKVGFNGGGTVMSPMSQSPNNDTTKLDPGERKKSERVKAQPKKFQDYILDAMSSMV